MSALTTVHVYCMELEKLIAIEIEKTLEPMANGYVESIEEYRKLVGKIAGLRTAVDLMKEADRVCVEKYR